MRMLTKKDLFGYEPDAQYSTAAAYFSMEFAIDQALKIYSGGLGFLAGSHLRSAYQLKQNLMGIGILWKYGYYDQGRDKDRKPLALLRCFYSVQMCRKMITCRVPSPTGCMIRMKPPGLRNLLYWVRAVRCYWTS